MKEDTTYTAPAVVASTDAVQNTKAVIPVPFDGDPDRAPDTPGSVGFFV